jgi:hypothetical protein
VSGDDSRCALTSLGAIAQGAILPGEDSRRAILPGTGDDSRCALMSLGVIAQGAILPGTVTR